MENFPVLLTDGEIVDLYFAINSHVDGVRDMAEHWRVNMDFDAMAECHRAIERYKALRAKLSAAQDVIRGNLGH